MAVSPKDADSATANGTPARASQPRKPVVIRVSPTAQFAVGFLALGVLALLPVLPALAPLLLIPLLLSVALVRYRTVASPTEVTARTLFSSRTVPWERVAGLKFVRSSWAKAVLTDDSELTLPAVTFAMLPLLTEVSGGKVPNPYQ